MVTVRHSTAASSAMLVFLAVINDAVTIVDAQEWTLLYSEDFSTATIDDSTTDWVLEDYSEPFDTIMDENGLWWQNDYGPAFLNEALDSFTTYRKEFPIGQDGWLTASLSARDWNKDGTIEDPPTLVSKLLPDGSGYVAEMNVPDFTGGVILRNTNPLPAEYRIEYKLKTIDFGGKRGGEIEYDGRVNGYTTERCKTQHPWGAPWRNGGWSGNASAPYCEWTNVVDGDRAYNGFMYMSIVDFANPAPRNNHFWHIRRKIQMEAFHQHPDAIGDGTGGSVCNSDTSEYYNMSDSSLNTVQMWMCGLPPFQRGWGQLTSTRGYFMSTCSDGVAEKGLSGAAELQPELMPDEHYTFAIERNSSGYTLELSGNFALVGEKTLRFHRPFIVDDIPIWHYNVDASEYDGRYNEDLVQDGTFSSTTWPNQWPAGSAYPDSFVIGDTYTNVYEGKASLTDIRLFVVSDPSPPPTPSPLPPPTPSPITASPTASPPSSCGVQDYQKQCNTTKQCKNMYDEATDCKNSEGGVCFCDDEVCGCHFTATPSPPLNGGTPSDPTASPTASSPSSCGVQDYQKQCRTTKRCKNMYDEATDCKNSEGGVCFCDDKVCGCHFTATPSPPTNGGTSTGGIGACDPTVDCDKDSDCADGLWCADEHKAQLKAMGFKKRLANCDIDIVNRRWEVCFNPEILSR